MPGEIQGRRVVYDTKGADPDAQRRRFNKAAIIGDVELLRNHPAHRGLQSRPLYEQFRPVFRFRQLADKIEVLGKGPIGKVAELANLSRAQVVSGSDQPSGDISLPFRNL